MNQQTGIFYFSPTKTTETICRTIAGGMGSAQPYAVDITAPDFRNNLSNLPEQVDHWIVGAPVYLGKLPLQFIEAMDAIRVDRKRATAVVVYGNRDYGIALRQLVEILAESGFQVVSAGTFIGQHSYAKIFPIALDRPDENDLEKAHQFGKKCLEITKSFDPEEIPMQLDMISRQKKYSYPLQAVYRESECTHCGSCAEVCPTGIIEEETGRYRSEKMKKECVGCMACVSNCEDGARIIKPGLLMYWFLKNYLKKAANQRLEPMILFPN